MPANGQYGELLTGLNRLFHGRQEAPRLFNGDGVGTTPGRPPELFRGPTEDAGLTNDNLGHIYTFAGLWNASSRTYSWRWDEAYRRSRQDALAMRRDCFLQALLKERQYATVQAPWHLEPEDKNDPAQREAADYITAIMEAVPDFQQLMMSMQEAIWYGRAGVNLRWGWDRVRGKRVLRPLEFYPVNGDKVQFTWEGIPEIMVYPGIMADLARDGANVRTTDRTTVLVLDKQSWRDKWIISQHDRIDADYFESDQHGGVHGVGVRTWCYWNWWLKTELSSYMFEFMERVGTGFSVYYYDPADPKAQSQAIQIAKQQGRNTWIVWPRQPGESGKASGVERIEPNTGGAQFLQQILEYFDEKIERFIIGQSMSSGADNESGLGGTGRALFAKSTKQLLISSDAEKRAGELTRDLVMPLLRYNLPNAQFKLKHIIDLESSDPMGQLQAAQIAWSMGVTLDADEVRQKTGFSKPSEDADILGGAEQSPMPLQGGMGGQQGIEPPAPPQPAQMAALPAGDADEGAGHVDGPAVEQMAAESDEPELELLSWYGEGQEVSTPLGPPAEWRQFADWLDEQPLHCPELRRLVNDGHTDPYDEEGSIEALRWELENLEGGPDRLLSIIYEASDGARGLMVQEGTEKMAAEPPKPPLSTWQPRLFGGKENRAVQRKLLPEHDVPEPPKEKPRQDLPGQTTFYQADGTPVRYDASTGRWITIGKKDDEGKRHGSHVFVEGGKIVKGAPTLVGRKLGSLQEPASFTHRQELHQSKDYGRAVWAKKARQAKINPHDLHEIASDIQGQDAEAVSGHNSMLKEARKALAEFGGGARTIAARQARSSKGPEEGGSIRGMDEVAEHMAAKYPHLFYKEGGEHGHHDDQLFAMLQEGNRQALTEEEAYQQAFDQLMEKKRIRDEEPVPFQRGRPQR